MTEDGHAASSGGTKILADLDRNGPIPLYYQLAKRIEEAIETGALRPGAKLDNEISLAQHLSLSRPTVRRALQELVDKGMLVRRRGIGTQVVHGRLQRRVELTSLYDDLKRDGQKPSTRVLQITEVPADPRIAEALALTPGAGVTYIHRVRYTDGIAVAILENYLPSGRARFTSDDLATQGLYETLRTRGVNLRVAKQRIGSRNATAAESELLGIEHRAALLTMDRTAYDTSGEAVEYGRHCYRPDLYSFEITVVGK